jgi:hypothetical protein
MSMMDSNEGGTMKQTKRTVAVLAAAATIVLVVPMGHAGAATKNPCKLVKPAQISNIFDQPVAKGKKGLTTAVSKSCEFEVALTDTKPDGGVSTYLQFVGADIAFETNREDLGDLSVDVSGLGGDAFYQPTGSDGGVVWVLKGDVLLTVQGVFFALGDTPEVDPVELQDELVAVAKIAKKKV